MSNYEKKIRNILNDFFKNDDRYGFKNKRPLFLENAFTKKILEIDCYSAKHYLAVEVNGPCHTLDPKNSEGGAKFDSLMRVRSKDYLKQTLINSENEKHKKPFLFITVHYVNDKCDYRCKDKCFYKGTEKCNDDFDYITAFIYQSLFDSGRYQKYFDPLIRSKMNYSKYRSVMLFNAYQANINKFVLDEYYCFVNDPILKSYFNYDYFIYNLYNYIDRLNMVFNIEMNFVFHHQKFSII